MNYLFESLILRETKEFQPMKFERLYNTIIDTSLYSDILMFYNPQENLYKI